MTNRDDDPISLKTAAADFRLSVGILKASGLRGDLAIYKLGTRYYTTPTDVRKWVASCRVDQTRRDFTLIRRASSGSSETSRASSALAAAKETVQMLKSNLRNTSATSTSPKRQAHR